MSLDLGLVARLLAWRRGRAVPVASHRRVAISPSARILCPLQLAGEDATLHALAWGGPQGEPEVRCVPDPRVRDRQHALFAWLGERLETWLRESVNAGQLPQLWLPSTAALSLLDLLEERNRGAEEGAPGFRLRQALALLLRQAHLDGCQAVVVATEVLSAHWATGQQAGEDGHLGSLLVWLDPPAGLPLAEALAAAERVPMSTKTRPELDKEVLEPALRAWNRARRAGDAAAMATQEADIEAALRQTLTPIFAATQQAIAALQQSDLPELPALADLVKRDLQSFERTLNPPEPEPRKKKAHAVGHGAIALVAAEDALEQHAAALVHGDAVALAAARARGEAVACRVAQVHLEKKKNATSCQVALVSTQTVSRVRPGDTVSLRGLPHFQFKVLSVRGEGGQVRIVLALGKGKKRAAELREVQRCDLVPPPPNVGSVGGTIQRMQIRLAEVPWTHAERLPAPQPDPEAPDDPLADVEALR